MLIQYKGQKEGTRGMIQLAMRHGRAYRTDQQRDRLCRRNTPRADLNRAAFLDYYTINYSSLSLFCIGPKEFVCE